ncbi:IclR family transcriptional regulator [Oerskovia turbata]
MTSPTRGARPGADVPGGVVDAARPAAPTEAAALDTAARNSSQSLRRALAILDALRHDAARGLSLVELADVLGTHKSTVSRLLAPLVEVHLVRRTPTGRFVLGAGTLRLGQAYLEGLDLRTVAEPHLAALMRASGATCHLVVHDGLDVVYIDKKENTAVVRMASRIGRRMPLYCTGVGKAILAASDVELLESVLDHPMPAVTARTLTRPEHLRAEIRTVAQRGYAIDDRENEAEVRCVAAAVVDHTETAIGALSVSALASHMPPARVRELGPLVVQAARAVSAGMGSVRSGYEPTGRNA